MTNKEFKAVWDKMMKMIAVDLADEFDRNFERKAFFDKPWKARLLNNKGSLLISTGRLRRSIGKRVAGDSIIFTSDAPYAKLHNEGGEIVVTQKMRGWFWYMYTKTKLPLYKHLGCKKVGSKIRIPQRQFIGYHKTVDKIVEDNAAALMEQAAKRIKTAANVKYK